ncbi:hypothetical protein DSM106972_097980 [Dulcicalothrix desertica PCC 7102]|uniref:Uncharacterized protein n=2 Tax=Dulcicalothrix desertica TaxID=32056 RepID=A0A3S1BZY9_9CYAN|nr:hypothetical protein DSM106972_097980 [Dulcicalothrix desertica PCC 7102]
MFQSRPFVVQSKKDNVQQPDLKTSLMQTKNYGYHLHNMQTGRDSNTTAVQAKKPGESGNAEAIQMARAKYSPGQHGYKKKEQQRLSDQYGIPISGQTHQSEHPIGFEPLNRTSGLRRGAPGRSTQMDNKAPAYQEVRKAHEGHAGTGTNKNPDASGFNSRSYRDTQRQLLESGDVSSAVQINQLGYAFDPNFRRNAKTPQGLAANNSYNTMVNNMHTVEYAQGATNRTVRVGPYDRAEMRLARPAVETGQWPQYR